MRFCGKATSACCCLYFVRATFGVTCVIKVIFGNVEGILDKKGQCAGDFGGHITPAQRGSLL